MEQERAGAASQKSAEEERGKDAWRRDVVNK